MKSPLRFSKIAALLIPFSATAQSLAQITALSPEDQRAYREALSLKERNAERTRFQAYLRGRWNDDSDWPVPR